MLRRARLAALVLPALLLPAAASAARPTEPPTLWDFAREAELIVYADIRSVQPLPEPEESTGNDAIARLIVLEAWKGEDPAIVDVPHRTWTGCSTPPRYVEGRFVVAFLGRNGAAWTTLKLAYDTLFPRAEDLSALRASVREAARLQAKGRAKEPLRVAWAVRAATHPVTRWDGLFELMPSSDILHSAYVPKPTRDTSARLKPEQKRALAEAGVAQPSLDRTLPMLLAVLRDYPDPDLDRLAGGAIEGLLAEDEPPWWTRDVLLRGLERLGDPKLEAYRERLGEEFEEPDPDVMRTIWDEARRDLALPNFPKLRRRAPAAW